ncbi:MAG: lipoprotein [Burkholderiaceae bacterium]|nr:lipoprotein [Burkholderiaceae bacterium]
MLHSYPTFITPIVIVKLHSVLLRFGAIVVATSLLAACGQRGPLYMPDSKAPKTAKKTPPALPIAKPDDSKPLPASDLPPRSTTSEE